MAKGDVIDFIRNHLSLNEGAYIYKKLKPLTKAAVKALRSLSAPDKAYSVYDILQFEDFVVDNVQNVNCKRTMFVYVYSTVPSYLNLSGNEVCPSALIEKRSSYMLLLEYPHYIVIFKKNIVSLKAIREFVDTVSTNCLANALITVGTQFKKLTTSSMCMSENSIRTKSYEGNQLSFSLPMAGQNRNTVNKVTFTVGDDSYGISLNTSRLTKLGSKKDLNRLTKWVYEILCHIDSYNNANRTFLNNFAFPISWHEEYNNVTLSVILFNIFSLQDYIASKGDGSIYYKHDGDYRQLKSEVVNKIWGLGNAVELSLDTVNSTNDVKLYNITYPAGIKPFDKDIIVSSDKRKIAVSSKGRLSHLYAYIGGKQVKLLKIINTQKYFQVGFNHCAYIYMNGSLYQDANIGESMDVVVSVLQGENKIAESEYEKFASQQPTGTETDFGEHSLFHYVETEFFKDCDFIICDDLENEWADHICIKNDTVSFVHSKWKMGTGLSASSFQEVVGQALKNMGNMQHNGNRIREKRAHFLKHYPGTQIERARNLPAGKTKEQYVDEFIDKFENIIKNPNGIREVCLVVDFLSVAEFKSAMDNIRNGVEFAKRKYAIQLFWLLSSFISECRSNDMHCRIICHE